MQDKQERPDVERHAARTILQRGIKFKIDAPWYIKWFKKTITLSLGSPYLGTLMKVSDHYLGTGLKEHELQEVSVEQSLALMKLHGVAISKAVAVAVLNGRRKQWLFTGILARYLRWHCKPKELFALLTALLVYGGTSDFMNTTRSVRQMKITAPRLGQTAQGS